MSALFSHAVRWEFLSSNPISSGIAVGSGGKRGPSTGIRVSTKRAKAPTLLLPEQVKLGLTKLEFRDQLLVLLDGALGTRRGELAALRWQDCDFETDTFQIQHSYYWRRGGILKSAKTEVSAKPLPMHPALKLALPQWRTQSHQTQSGDFVFPSRLYGGRKALDLAAVLKRKTSRVREDRDHRSGLAHVPPYSRDCADRTGRASVDDPRLTCVTRISA